MEQMKRTFKHLQYRDRIKIEMMLREKASIQQIADRLHVTYQTIWRELRRDGVWYEHTLSNLTTERRYSADIAQAQYEKNKRAKGGMIKLGHDFALHDFIEQKIGREHYSPAAVIMEIKLRGLKFDVDICEKTIYNYINSGDVFFSITNKDLPQRGEHKREYKKVREAKRQAPGEGIENRPPEIDERKEEGHWEMDTVKGKKNGRKCALMLSERAMRTELVLPMAACTMECVARSAGATLGQQVQPHLQDDHGGQRQRVYGLRGNDDEQRDRRAAHAGLLLPSLSQQRARHQREPEPDVPPVLPERDGLGRRSGRRHQRRAGLDEQLSAQAPGRKDGGDAVRRVCGIAELKNFSDFLKLTLAIYVRAL